MGFVISEIADNTAIKLYQDGNKVDYIARKLNIGVGTLSKASMENLKKTLIL